MTYLTNMAAGPGCIGMARHAAHARARAPIPAAAIAPNMQMIVVVASWRVRGMSFGQGGGGYKMATARHVSCQNPPPRQTWVLKSHHIFKLNQTFHFRS